MPTSFPYLLICLVAGILLIVLLTTRYKVPAFFALILSALLVGLGIHLQLGEVITIMKDGFGNILKSLGLLIVLGTTLGVLLENTGSTAVMANYILKIIGQKRAHWVMSITGLIVGLPIFCDSGFIVLSGLNKNLAKKAGIPMAVMSVSLATGLYAIHCMAPPHPGSSAAAGIIGVDLGKLILYGVAVAVPGMIIGNIWANYIGSKLPAAEIEAQSIVTENEKVPAVFKAFTPILIPVLLIALKSFFSGAINNSNYFISILLAVGDPIPALIIGVLLTFIIKSNWTKADLSRLLNDSIEKAGGILVIIGAGGAFGAVLAASKIGVPFGQLLNLSYLGIFFPFLLTAVLKTAQGSSTVAIITASSIVQPLLHALGLDTETGKLLCVLAMGAGSMMISHANDAYFWVIAKFSGLDMKTMLKIYSIATVLMGMSSILIIYLLSKIL